MGVEVKKSCVIDMTMDIADSAMIHVCNNYGAHRSGVALMVRDRIPSSYRAYRDFSDATPQSERLGKVVYEDKVFSMIAQDDYYGRNGIYVTKKYINYGALAQCLIAVAEQAKAMGIKKITVPYRMGSDRAGGDWYVVLEMIQYFLGDFDIIVCDNSTIK